MDGSDHKNNPPSIPKGTDENRQSYQESNRPTKTTAIKHFMSPTISATSKTNPPRKKILAERNDSVDNSVQQTLILDSKRIQKATSLESKSISSTEFGDCEQNDVADDLSSRPYDPLTNYLSPRPKFFRYNPNRRRETLLQRESKEKEGTAGSDLEGDLAFSCGSLPQEGEEIDESDDEFEEVDEERGWSLREVLKVLILLVALVLSTSYTSSMNSPTPSPVVQAVAGLKDGYHKMQEHVYGSVKSIELGKYFLFDLEDGVVEEGMIEDFRIEEAGNTNELNEEVEIRSGENRVIETVEDDEKEGEVDKHFEGGENGEIEDEEEEGKVDKYTEEGESENGETEDEEEEGEADKYNEKGESEIEEIVELEEKRIVGQWDKIIELESGKFSDFSDSEMALTTVTGVADSLEEDEDVYEPIKEEISDRETGGIGNITDDYKNESEAGSNMKEGFTKHMETEIILKAVIGFSIFSSIIASTVLGLHFRKHRTARENTHRPVVEPCFDSVVAEKTSSLIANEKEKNNKSPASSAITKSVINFMEEDSKAIQKSSHRSFSHEIRAPIVELLSELEVGEMSSSLRSCDYIKSRMIESEVSSHSVSMEKGWLCIKPNSNPVHVQPADFSEISTMSNLPSYSDEKKTVQKQEQEGRDGEVKKNVVTTPLRRSNRIRNRSALSP